MRADLQFSSGAWISSYEAYGPLYTSTAGGIAYAYCQFPWSELVFQLKKGVQTQPKIIIAGSKISDELTAGQNGYYLLFAGSGAIRFGVILDGNPYVIAVTADGVILDETEYSFRVNYNQDTGLFTLYNGATELLSARDTTFNDLYYFVAVPEGGDAI